MIDMARLNQIEQRLEGTSDGEWCVVEQRCGDRLGDEVLYYTRIAIATPDGWIATSEHPGLHKDDYEFMANARQDIPWLIEQLKSLINAHV